MDALTNKMITTMDANSDNEQNSDNRNRVFDKRMLLHTRRSVVVIIIFWIDWLLIYYSWAFFQDDLFRIASLALYPILLSLAILCIVSIVYLIRKTTDSQRNIIIKRLVLIALAILLGFHTTYCFSRIPLLDSGTFEGSNSIESKGVDELGQHYFVVKLKLADEYYLNVNEYHVKLKCDEETFDNLIVNKRVEYGMGFRLGLVNRESGILQYINLNDYIDNRVT